MKVLVFVPTITGSIPNETVSYLMRMQTGNIQIWFQTSSRVLIHSARNMAVKQMLEWWFDYLFFLDDDNPPQHTDLIPRLVNHQKDIVWWVYRQRTNPEFLTIYKDVYHTETGLIRYEPYKNMKSKREDVIKVWNIATGCVLLSREVCEKMYNLYSQSPFVSSIQQYYQVEEMQPTGMDYVEATVMNWATKPPKVVDGKMKIQTRELSEDLLFFERCKQHWYKIHCDTKAHCYHIGKPTMLEV